jgi:hypothetical protein
MTESKNSNYTQNIVVKQKTNGLGTAGFILALIGLFLGWIPLFGWAIWFLGLIFSFIGVFKAPRGLSIAGLVISLVGLFLLVVVFAAVANIGDMPSLDLK